MVKIENSSLHASAWLIAVPKHVEFTQPLFHFGERVKFCQRYGREQNWETGRITGLKFDEQNQWICTVQLDANSSLVDCGVQEITASQSELTLIKDNCSVREHLQIEQQWFGTQETASRLGISANQLRKLRLNGLFKGGYHYRDISVPGSGLPRWQWHAGRCAHALQVPSEKRPPTFR